MYTIKNELTAALAAERRDRLRAAPDAAALLDADLVATPAATGTAGEVAHELTERAGADDVTLLVVGDSTGDERTEWVALWAARMADEGARVTYRDWVPGEERWTDDPLTLGDGDRHVTIVNASQAGARPGYPLARRLLPDAADLVLVSFGHNGTREQEVAEMRQLLDRLAQDYPDAPVGVIAQNPALGGSVEHSRANREAVEQVARARDLPVIDVHGAFVDHGDVESLLVDDTITAVVQVKGKVKDRLEVPVDIAEDDLRELALGSEAVQRAIGDAEIRKIIVRAPKLVNIVV